MGQMIYLQFKPACEVGERQVVRLGYMARVSPNDAELEALAIDVPARGRQVDALEVIERIEQLRPGERVHVLGAGGVFVSRRAHRRGPLAWAMKVVLILLLFGGAAMGMTFFHADVNMLEAQRALCEMVGGGGSALDMAVPYAIGVFAGVGAFMLLGGRARSPLALKLRQYRQQLEQADAGEDS